MDEFDIENTTEECAVTENSAIDEKTFGIKKKRKFPKFNIMWVAIAAFLVWLILIARVPALADNFAFNVIIRLLIGAPFIICAISNKEQRVIPFRIGLVMLGVGWILTLFFGGKVLLIYDMITIWYGFLVFLLSFTSLFGGYRELKIRGIMGTGVCLDFLLFFNDMRMYNYVEGEKGSVKFWLPALIIGVLLGALAGYLLFTGAARLKDNRKSEKIASIFIVCFIFFALTWSSANHLNFALDTSEPYKMEQEIIGKDKDTSGDSTDYYLIVEINGEKTEIAVYGQDYRRYEIGDTFSIYYCEGAFGEPFYVY